MKGLGFEDCKREFAAYESGSGRKGYLLSDGRRRRKEHAGLPGEALVGQPTAHRSLVPWQLQPRGETEGLGDLER